MWLRLLTGTESYLINKGGSLNPKIGFYLLLRFLVYLFIFFVVNYYIFIVTGTCFTSLVSTVSKIYLTEDNSLIVAYIFTYIIILHFHAFVLFILCVLRQKILSCMKNLLVRTSQINGGGGLGFLRISLIIIIFLWFN
jgi:hypothetical protein